MVLSVAGSDFDLGQATGEIGNMQGTMVVLMALSGLGCHHRNCDVAYVPACYSSCYGGGWDGCYGGGPSYVSGCYSAPVVVESGYAGWSGGCYSSCYGGGYGG